ncbi:phage/plasmid primase, P4 family [Blastopirellula sp. J2-11]|uniref:phage/plasmid primase, P4 family n=1 Tax=Blastopirellula sp. J2-11 TaxID=2943192 RepID=UPI0021C9319E|nr:phage/plasmid primase, P4 family [Blastopirellula sp. J2-11]UUO05332.1 phage/plasmid primase, P4 family [Blastopirellula sp. J2-11]
MIVRTGASTAHEYVRRGWSVVPVPHRSKNPGFNDWQKLRIQENELDQYFKSDRQNIGVLLGEPSGWLIDIDLDHSLAVDLADQYLTPTDAVFGRTSRPGSHRIYQVTGPLETKKLRSKKVGMLVEIRSTGMQTVFPDSTHESGEPIRWENEDPEPAIVDPEQLLDCVQRLADAVLVQLGEGPSPVTVRQPAKSPMAPKQVNAVATDPTDSAALCLEAMLRIRLTDKSDGSYRLFVAACRTVEYDLDDQTALATIREYARQQPFPKDWTDDEVLKRIRDAEQKCQRGQAFEMDSEGYVPLGNRDPASGRVVLSPKRTLPTAEAYVRDFHFHPEGRTIHFYANQLIEWRNNRYVDLEDGAVKKRLQEWLHAALRYIPVRGASELELVDFESNPMTVNAALESIRSHTHLPETVASPSWLGKTPEGLQAEELLPCRSTLLHLPTMRHLPPNPRFFTLNALEFDPDPSAPAPTAWYEFLHQLFEDDMESLDLLQEWFGYCLTADTSQQKMLLMVGPRRSGKGTIGRVLTRLIGQGNVSGPTTSSLAGAFGLQPLIGKSLAIVSDARFHGDNIATVVERLLCISGEDALTVDRKFMGSLTLKLRTRFMFLTNEFPRLSDSSGALAGRFMILRFTRTFYGQEDAGLTDRLFGELPGILNWAIEGWQRLRERGHFIMPSGVADVVQDIEDLSSPVSAFVRDRCAVQPGNRIGVNELYDDWKRWCEDEGRNLVSTKQVFGRDLSAAVPGVTRRRGTGQQPFYDGITLKGTF